MMRMNKKMALGMVLLCMGILSFLWFATATYEYGGYHSVTKYKDVTKYRWITKYREVNHPYSTLETKTYQNLVAQNAIVIFGSISWESFVAHDGYWIELDILSTGGDANIEIVSSNNGKIFDVIGSSFIQTVNLYYDDSYKITIYNHSFGTITVSGEIKVLYKETVWHDNWVQEPYQEQEAYVEQEPYQVNEYYTEERRVFPEYFLILPLSLVVISVIIIKEGATETTKKEGEVKR
jgi:hypothetical protein